MGACGAGRRAAPDLLRPSASQDHAAARARRLGPNRRDDHVGGIGVTYRSLLLRAATIQTQTSNTIMPMTMLKPAEMIMNPMLLGGLYMVDFGLTMVEQTGAMTATISWNSFTGRENSFTGRERSRSYPQSPIARFNGSMIVNSTNSAISFNEPSTNLSAGAESPLATTEEMSISLERYISLLP